MTTVYVGDLKEPGGIQDALTSAGFEVSAEPTPDEPGADELSVIAAGCGLTASFRHRLNNPLTAVLGFTELLLRNYALTSDVEKKIRQIQQNAMRVREMLLASREVTGSRDVTG